MIAANVSHFFQVHLNAYKARNFDFMVQNRQTCAKRFLLYNQNNNGIDLMFCLPPHVQAEKLSMMNLNQKRPFLFPYVLMQMEGDDIVQSVLNLPLDKKVNQLFYPSEASALWSASGCVFDCLSDSQKAQVFLELMLCQ